VVSGFNLHPGVVEAVGVEDDARGDEGAHEVLDKV
jgi:hypothetical protein